MRRSLASFIAMSTLLVGCSADPLPEPTREFTADITNTATPSKVIAVAADQQVTINWTSVDEASAYEVYSVDGDEPILLDTVSGNRFVHTNITNGEKYQYRIKAITKQSAGPLSALVSATPQQRLTPPAPIEKLKIQELSNAIAVSWEDVEGALGYQIFYTSETELTADTAIRLIDTTPPSIITGLTNEQSYLIAVAPVNLQGVGEWSSISSGTPSAERADTENTGFSQQFNAIAQSNLIRLEWPIVIDTPYHVSYKVEGNEEWEWLYDVTSGYQHTERQNDRQISYKLYTGLTATPTYLASTNATPSDSLDNEIFYVPDASLSACIEQTKQQRGYVYAADFSVLSCPNQNISDLTGLGEYKYLTTLNLAHNQVADISEIANISNLRVLNLYNNQVTDVSSLVNLVNIQKLALDSNPIADLSPLTQITSLLELGLNRVANSVDITAESVHLPNLLELRLSGANIVDVNLIAQIPSLKYLDLSDNYISNIDSLAALKSLIHLDLRRNLNLSTSNIKNMFPNLKYFNSNATRTLAAPTELRFERDPETQTATISWNEVDDASSYNLYDISGDEPTLVFSGDATSTVVELPNSKTNLTLRYAATAFYAGPELESSPSNRIAILIEGSGENTIELPIPNLLLTNTATGVQIDVNPNLDNTELEILIFRAAGLGETGIGELIYTSSTEFTFIDTTPDSGELNTYSVFSTLRNNTSERSTVASESIRYTFVLPSDLEPVLTDISYDENAIRLQWTSAAPETQVYRHTSEVFDPELVTDIGIVTPNDNGYRLVVETQTSPGTNYYYFLQGVSGETRSNVVSIAALTPPAPPAGVIWRVPQFDENTLELNWLGVAGADNYSLYLDVGEASSDNQFGELIYSGKNTSFEFANFSFDQTYRFRVSSTNTTGESQSATGLSVDTTRPPAPELSSIQATDGIDFSWSSFETINRYILASHDNEQTTVLYDGPATSVFIELSEDKTYPISINSVNEFGVVSQTEINQISWAAPPLPAPTNFELQPSAQDVAISWEAVDGAEQYELVRVDYENESSTIIYTGTNTEFLDSTLDFGKEYTYEVYAIAGKPGLRSTLLFRFIDRIPSPPSNLLLETGNDSISMTWLPGNGAEEYDITVSIADNLERNSVPETIIRNGVINRFQVPGNGSTTHRFDLKYPLVGAQYTVTIASSNQQGLSGGVTDQIIMPGALISELIFEDQTFQSCVAENAANIEYAVNMTSLFCNSYGLFSIGGIEQLPNLTQVSFRQNYIDTFAPLNNLLKLTDVDLAQTWEQPVDIAVLNANSSIISLNLDQALVDNIDLLANFKNIRTLNVNELRLETIDFIPGMTGLTKLVLSKNVAVDLSPLAQAPALKHLELDYTSLDPETGTLLFNESSPLLGIEVLSIAGTEITDITFAGLLPELTLLNISETSITELSGLALAPKLEGLTISRTQIADLSPLAQIDTLIQLVAQDAGMNETKLAGLANTSLSVLLMANASTTCCGEDTSEPLDPLTNVFQSDTAFDPLKNLPNLQILQAQGTGLYNIDALYDIATLESVNLFNNNDIWCADLDQLEIQLNALNGNLTRPEFCVEPQ